jgi:thiosulfate dehydrogenase
MASRFGWFVLGCIVTLVAVAVGAWLFVANGGVAMETNAAPLPFETTFAKMAIRAAVADSRKLPDPLPYNEENMVAGATLFRSHCAGCHGLPGKPSRMGKAEFPHPPQLFTPVGMVTDDPEGVTFWKVTNGIRLSGMPSFGDVLTEDQRWQLAMLLRHADKLTPAVSAALLASQNSGGSSAASANNSAKCSCTAAMMQNCPGMKSMMPGH